MIKKLYVGCALTQAPEEFKLFVVEVKSKLREAGFEVFDFVGTVNGTPADVYAVDSENVRNCDVFVALCDYPSIGLGMEFELATRALRKPTLALAGSGVAITRMVTGAASAHSHVKCAYYKDAQDVVDAVCDFCLDPAAAGA